MFDLAFTVDAQGTTTPLMLASSGGADRRILELAAAMEAAIRV